MFPANLWGCPGALVRGGEAQGTVAAYGSQRNTRSAAKPVAVLFCVRTQQT